jgi:Fe-S-cluster containining protein
MLFDRLESVHSIYIRAEEAMASFRARNGLVCPPRCGVCCENFIPDVLPVEASYLAAWLVRNRPEQARSMALDGFSGARDRPQRGCPLYDPAAPDAHCTVYPGRPLICRLFAFSGTRSKSGRPAYALCRLMPELPPPRSGRRSWEGPELEAALGLPPIMSDFSMELDGTAPGDAGRRSPLPEALVPAVRQMLFLTGFSDPGHPGTDGNDPVVPPLGRAS